MESPAQVLCHTNVLTRALYKILHGYGLGTFLNETAYIVNACHKVGFSKGSVT